MLVIIILGKNVHGGETVFYDGENMNDTVKRAHVMNHSHGRCVVSTLDKILHKGYVFFFIKVFYLLSSTNQYFFTLYIIVRYFITKI